MSVPIRRLILLGLSAVALSHGIFACSREEPSASDDAAEVEGAEGGERFSLTPRGLASLDLRYETVARRELGEILEVPAELAAAPDRRVTIGSRVAGRVVAVHANVGDSVGSEAPLVELDSDVIGRARADLIAAVARVDVARRAARRARQLHEDRIGSERAVEEAEGALQVAGADLQAARARLRSYGVDTNGAAADNPGRVVLSSPIGGTVIARRAHIGQWVAPADVLVEVVDLDELWILGAVPERRLRHVRTGDPVEVDVRAHPGERFTGTVEQIAGALDERTRSVMVRIVLPNPNHRLKPGMFATARIRAASATSEPVLSVPESALHELEGEPVVFVRLGEGSFKARPVRTVHRAGGRVAIAQGLEVGEEVVVEGGLLLKGQVLRETLAEDED